MCYQKATFSSSSLCKVCVVFCQWESAQNICLQMIFFLFQMNSLFGEMKGKAQRKDENSKS